MMDMDLSLDIELTGHVDLGERFERPGGPGDVWSTERLVWGDDHDITISLLVIDGVASIRMAAFHVENPETRRGFHTTVEVHPDAGQVRLLAKALLFLADNAEASA